MKAVTAAIVIQEERVLLTRRAQGQKLAGYWEFPGGKVELGETLQSCLERELLEELGVKATAGDVLVESEYHYEHGAIRLIAIQTSIASNDFVLSVHDQADWVPIESLLTYDLAPADIPIAHYLQS